MRLILFHAMPCRACPLLVPVLAKYNYSMPLYIHRAPLTSFIHRLSHRALVQVSIGYLCPDTSLLIHVYRYGELSEHGRYQLHALFNCLSDVLVGKLSLESLASLGDLLDAFK